MDTPLIQFKNVSLTYGAGTSGQVIATENVTLEIKPQEYVIFFGPSGSGKSTLLYMAAGLNKPDSGEIIVDGHNVPELNEKQLISYHRSTIGFIFQAFYLIPNLSIKDNILLPQIFRKSSQQERTSQLDKLAKRFDIEQLLSKKPSELSGGQQQRVAAARALINNPSIILADEPVGNLDTKNAEITMNLLDELNQVDKKTVILVTHDPRYLPYAHRVFHMLDGKVVKETRNAHKQSIYYSSQPKSALTELEKFALMYPNLPEDQLKARLVLNQILSPFSLEEQEHLEGLVVKYMTQGLTKEQLKQELDAPEKLGGMALYRQTAHHMADRIDSVITEIAEVSKMSHNKAAPVNTAQIRTYLLGKYKGHVKPEHLERFDTIILRRLNGDIDDKEFANLLDMNYSKGGLGLMPRSAKNLSRELELILIDKE